MYANSIVDINRAGLHHNVGYQIWGLVYNELLQLKFIGGKNITILKYWRKKKIIFSNLHPT